MIFVHVLHVYAYAVVAVVFNFFKKDKRNVIPILEFGILCYWGAMEQ